ncbi:hypothetical protein COO60DRAFT_1626982 [Scenedesmus sp. NREL 46B-D3]|nr:hypothetical protein COO60DRAFT_1626982 [Scenedesmus sp. NREL 46B-D3]
MGRKPHGLLVVPCVLLCVAVLATKGHGASLTVVKSINDIWGNVAMQAAEATLKAIQKQTGLTELSLRDVPMDSFQVYIGRQHHLAIEVAGQQYELVLNNQPGHDAAGAAGAGPAAAPKQKALPMPDLTSSALAEFDPYKWQRQHIELPEITLAGPVELVFSRRTDLSLFLPHSTDVPAGRRLLLGPGAALTLRQLKGISLRKPLELPQLPKSYLAEVYAHMAIGEPDPGFENAPGMLFLAGELYRAATNASFGIGDAGGRTKQLLSFEIEPAGRSVTIVAARQPGDGQQPRLRLKKQQDGTLEITLRDAAAAAAAAAGAQAAALPGGMPPSALAPRAWAWPLPLVGVSDWVSYESLLRSILAAHPLTLQQGLNQGLALRLTKSSVKGVSLIHFDMELKAPAAVADVFPPADSFLPMDLIEGGQDALEVWEAVVEVKERKQKDGSSGVQFVPLSVKRKHAYHSTLTLSPAAVAMAVGKGNASSPLGTESVDWGWHVVQRRGKSSDAEHTLLELVDRFGVCRSVISIGDM